MVNCDCGVRTPTSEATVWPIRCLCGRYHGRQRRKAGRGVQIRIVADPSRRAATYEKFANCTSGCPHFGDHETASGTLRGCGLINHETDSPLPAELRKPCRTFDHIYRGGNCPDDPPRF